MMNSSLVRVALGIVWMKLILYNLSKLSSILMSSLISCRVFSSHRNSWSLLLHPLSFEIFAADFQIIVYPWWWQCWQFN
jgi:hypothetical protein